jgi:hypothetical protein
MILHASRSPKPTMLSWDREDISSMTCQVWDVMGNRIQLSYVNRVGINLPGLQKGNFSASHNPFLSHLPIPLRYQDHEQTPLPL